MQTFIIHRQSYKSHCTNFKKDGTQKTTIYLQGFFFLFRYSLLSQQIRLQFISFGLFANIHILIYYGFFGFFVCLLLENQHPWSRGLFIPENQSVKKEIVLKQRNVKGGIEVYGLVPFRVITSTFQPNNPSNLRLMDCQFQQYNSEKQCLHHNSFP